MRPTGYDPQNHDALTFANAAASRRTPPPISPKIAPSTKTDVQPDPDHFVQFYESDDFLVNSICNYIGAGLVSGEAALVIATEPHRIAIDAELQARGFDVSVARSQNRYLSLDAADLLAQFTADGIVDAGRFTAVAGHLLSQLGRGGRRTRAFGEMVALLWSRGQHAAAVRLEELWNELAPSHDFGLLCAYPLRDFADPADRQPFRDICGHHARTLPAESYSSLPDRDDRLRAVAELQQKANCLDAEVARRNAAQHALVANERELADFFDNALEGLHKIGPDGVILWANRAELRLLGYDAHEYVGRHVADFHADRDVIDDILARLARGESIYNHPARLRRKDGSLKHVLINCNACLDDSGRLAYARCFTHDTTAQHLAEQELRAAKAAAEHANRAKDQFLATLSHELRTPLTPVLLAVGSIADDPELPARLRDDLSMIRRNISLETRLIDDLLDLSRAINGKMSLQVHDVDLHAVLRNVLDMVAQDAAAKQITLRPDLAAPRHQVRGDSARLHQALWNLLHNAIKFTPESGAVAVRTRNDEQSSALVIEIVDTGVGISPRALPSIFDAFNQGEHSLKHIYGGLGLGLAIAKAVLDLHQGALSAFSSGLGQGSTFTLTLPVTSHTTVERGAAQNGPAGPSAAVARPDALHILLVEDHPDTLKVLRRLLESDGYRVTTAASVSSAAAAVAGASFDLLISDIGLPDGSGLDLLRQLRPQHPHLPAIAMTGFGMEQDIRNSLDAGFAMHLTKPIDLASLKAAIREFASATPARSKG